MSQSENTCKSAIFIQQVNPTAAVENRLIKVSQYVIFEKVKIPTPNW